jgi:hypothetical protein
VALTASPAASAATPSQPSRFVGQVTDALRTPAHRLLADATSGRVRADLVFLDRERARTAYRACVARRDGARLRTCYAATTGRAGVPTITPLRFPRGRYAVSWTVAGEVVASWRFSVI